MTPIPLHHTHDEICPLCTYKLIQTHPYMTNWFNGLIKPKWEDAHISWSYRDEASQNACYYAKPQTSKLLYPNSAHNKTDEKGNPCSWALDLFQLSLDHGAVYSSPFFNAVDKLNQLNGLSILWGGKWLELGDSDHYQFSTQ